MWELQGRKLPVLLNLQSSRGLGISRETDMAGCAECQVSNTVAAAVLQSRVGEPCWAAEAEVAPGGGGRPGWSTNSMHETHRGQQRNAHHNPSLTELELF